MSNSGKLAIGGTEVYAQGMTGGTDCTAQLQMYFTQAQNTGFPLVIPASQNGLAYKVSSILRAWSGARILGNGAVIDFQTDHSSTGVGLFIGSETTTSGISDVQITGLEIISSNASGRNGVYGLISVFNSSRIVLTDISVGNSTAHSGGESVGIFTMNSSDIRITRPRIQNTYADGIHLSRATLRATIDHPIIIGAQDDGVAVVSVYQDGTTGPIYGPCRYIDIVQPTVLNSSVNGSGITLIGGQDCNVIGGSIDTVPASGVQITQANYGGIINPARNTVTGINIANASSTGGCIRVGNATDTVVSGVNSESSYAGIVILSSANTVVNAVRISSTGASQYGVYDDTASSRTNVTGSILTGNTSGAYLLQGTGSIQSGNITA